MTRLGIQLADDRGAVLALVAMMLIIMLTLTALVIDVGGALGVRQRLVPAIDAAALAAAQDMVHYPTDPTGACNTATSYIAENAPEASVTGCDVELFPEGGGQVTVSVSQVAEGGFANLGGSEDRAVGASASATWGEPTTVSGVVPVGICYDGSSDLQDAIDNPLAAHDPIHLSFIKEDLLACGGLGSLGNFLSIDPGQNSSIWSLRDWSIDGYPGQVAFGPPSNGPCVDGDPACVGRPYAIPGINWALDILASSGDYTIFPIYDHADADQVHLIGFVRARLLNFFFDPYWPLDSWWLELDIEPGLVRGTCCGSTGFATSNQVVALCGVDPDDQTACEPTPGP